VKQRVIVVNKTT